MLIALAGKSCEIVNERYGDRESLARLTGGYIYVPVLELDDGRVLTESRAICEEILRWPSASHLVPSPWEGPIWAYHDFCDGALEDATFRLASPAIRDSWTTAFERALYVLIKERKYGAGCVDAWEAGRAGLLEQSRRLLAPTLSTLSKQEYVFGDAPTLADASLYGTCAMIGEGDPALLEAVAPALVGWAKKLERFAAGVPRS
jgi:glutathione S-transferase